MATLKPRAGMRLTVEEFLELPDTWDRRKMELDEGVLYIMAKPRLVYQFFNSSWPVTLTNTLTNSPSRLPTYLQTL